MTDIKQKLIAAAQRWVFTKNYTDEWLQAKDELIALAAEVKEEINHLKSVRDAQKLMLDYCEKKAEYFDLIKSLPCGTKLIRQDWVYSAANHEWNWLITGFGQNEFLTSTLESALDKYKEAVKNE